MKRLLSTLFDPAVHDAKRKARQYVETNHPHWRVGGVSLRANEPERFVFAVFYTRETPQRPDPYLLVFVAKQSSIIEEENPSPDSKYWIRGRK